MPTRLYLQKLAEQVVEHNQWKATRGNGHRPSMHFLGLRNPMKALAFAKGVLNAATSEEVSAIIVRTDRDKNKKAKERRERNEKNLARHAAKLARPPKQMHIAELSNDQLLRIAAKVGEIPITFSRQAITTAPEPVAERTAPEQAKLENGFEKLLAIA